jgi:hypothetical protein
MQAFAEIVLAIDHAHMEAAGGQLARARKAGESRTHHDHVIAVVLHGGASAPSSVWRRSVQTEQGVTMKSR